MMTKNSTKKALARFIHPFVARLGYRLDDDDIPEDPLKNFFQLLKSVRFEPRHIVDVGANHGMWTRTALRYYPDAFYTLLEPQKWLEEQVSDLLKANPKVKFYPVGAGSQAGSFKFTLTGRDDSSTFRATEEQAAKLGLTQIDVPVVTLNELIAQQQLPVPDMIKIDAEGLDIEVVKGASDFFGKAELFLVEAGVVSKEIDNNALKVLTFMDENGYRLFDVSDLNRPFGTRVLWLMELVFIKKGGVLDSQVFS